jgi:hypothetical protein
MENWDRGSLAPYKVLLLTYEGQKPPSAEFHAALAKWVRAGGALIVVDDQGDPYNSARGWWDATKPQQKLLEDFFAQLGVTSKVGAMQRVGLGSVLWKQVSPAALSHSMSGADQVLGWTREAAGAAKLAWKESHALVLRRGPYVVAAGLNDGAAPLRGHFVDLFDPALGEVSEVSLATGQRHLLMDVDRVVATTPKVIAGSARVRKESFAGNTLALETDGIAESDAVLCVRTTRSVAQVTVNGTPLAADAIHAGAKTVLIRYQNSDVPSQVSIRFDARVQGQ